MKRSQRVESSPGAGDMSKIISRLSWRHCASFSDSLIELPAAMVGKNNTLKGRRVSQAGVWAQGSIMTNCQPMLFCQLNVFSATDTFKIDGRPFGKTLQPIQVVPIESRIVIRWPFRIRFRPNTGLSIACSTLELLVCLAMTEDVGVDCE
jgi:hypothetical protein